MPTLQNYSFGGVEHCLFGFRLARKAGVLISVPRSVSEPHDKRTYCHSCGYAGLCIAKSRFLLSGLCLMCWHMIRIFRSWGRGGGSACNGTASERAVFDWTCLKNASGEISKQERSGAINTGHGTRCVVRWPCCHLPLLRMRWDD